MSSDRETKKLGAEELSKRVAPLSTPIVVPTDPTVDPGTTGGGGGSLPADQPGKSDPHRTNPWPKSEP